MLLRPVGIHCCSIGGIPVTPGAAQPTFGGVRDWFVAKLDPSGASLDWATYLGGSDFDGLSPTLRVDRKVTLISSGRPPQPISRRPATPSKPPMPARSTSPSFNSIAAGACCSPPTSAAAARRTAPAYRRRSTGGATFTSAASRPHPTSQSLPVRSSRHTAAETSTALSSRWPFPVRRGSTLDEDRP
jgi:hypothetical protein